MIQKGLFCYVRAAQAIISFRTRSVPTSKRHILTQNGVSCWATDVFLCTTDSVSVAHNAVFQNIVAKWASPKIALRSFNAKRNYRNSP